MSDTCNATLTTATVEPCPQTNHPYDGVVCDGDVHVTLHTLTCNLDASHNGHRPLPDHLWGGTNWHDDTPGATPHTPPLVTDEEFNAAYAAFDSGASAEWDDQICLRAALEAAAKVRRGTQARDEPQIRSVR